MASVVAAGATGNLMALGALVVVWVLAGFGALLSALLQPRRRWDAIDRSKGGWVAVILLVPGGWLAYVLAIRPKLQTVPAGTVSGNGPGMSGASLDASPGEVRRRSGTLSAAAVAAAIVMVILVVDNSDRVEVSVLVTSKVMSLRSMIIAFVLFAGVATYCLVAARRSNAQSRSLLSVVGAAGLAVCVAGVLGGDDRIRLSLVVTEIDVNLALAVVVACAIGITFGLLAARVASRSADVAELSAWPPPAN